ncbi:MAG: deaminase [Ignavibacteriales bacterium]|nr:deaminase [Ignavibacteriales bacterium]
MNNITNYLSSLYNNTDEPFVIGLTGYTGVGCSTTKEILLSKNKPEIPGYNSINISFNLEIITKMDERVYNKLKYYWNKTAWEPFISIEVSKIIFSFFLDALIKGRISKTEFPDIANKIEKNEQKLKGIYHFSSPDPIISIETASELIDAYEVSKEIYSHFKQKYIKKELGNFIERLQNLGDEIRRYGSVDKKESDREIKAENIFTLPKAMNKLIRAFILINDTHSFVIDTLKNPYEIEYFKHQYSKFYLIGVLRDVDKREKNMLERLDYESSKKIENREKAEMYSKNNDEFPLRITSQDIDECIKKADMFIYNQESESKNFEQLRFGIIKLVTLSKRPGCVTPTQDERCMQLAMTVRLVSGCISRQVGAIVIDKERKVIGVGWNDSPKGQIPCALRTCEELVNNSTPLIFSGYERSEKFTNHIKGLKQREEPFCFRTEKAVIDKKKEAEYTRALHAEENALFQASANGYISLIGSTLYTTSRTCNLCAKKAYQLGVKRIVYIDEYYDIAIEQTLKAGNKQIIIERFSGIIGQAYHKLYTAPMPEKSIIELEYNIA